MLSTAGIGFGDRQGSESPSPSRSPISLWQRSAPSWGCLRTVHGSRSKYTTRPATRSTSPSPSTSRAPASDREPRPGIWNAGAKTPPSLMEMLKVEEKVSQAKSPVDPPPPPPPPPEQHTPSGSPSPSMSARYSDGPPV